MIEERAKKLINDIDKLVTIGADDGNLAQQLEWEMIRNVAEWLLDPDSVDDPIDPIDEIFRDMLDHSSDEEGSS